MNQLSATDAVEVGVGVLRHVVVEDNVDALDVHASTEQVGCDKNALLEVLELLVAVQTTHTQSHDICDVT